MHDPSNTADAIEPIDAKEIVSGCVRRLFRLGKALNVPGGVPGSLYTAFGSLKSVDDQWNADVLAEEKATNAAGLQKFQVDAKAEAEAREKNLVATLI